MSAKTSWTPYGLEAIRIAHLRRRRIFSVLLALGLCALWLFMFSSTTESRLSISVNGQEQATGIQLDIPDQVPKNGPVTVAIDPGRVTSAETTGPGQATSVQRSEVPTFERAAPLNWNYYVLLYGPYALLALALYLLAKKRGKHDEVNYGIYKGAMPLEMMTASAEKQVFTTRFTERSIFGKRRADYLPREVALLERVPQEDDS